MNKPNNDANNSKEVKGRETADDAFLQSSISHFWIDQNYPQN